MLNGNFVMGEQNSLPLLLLYFKRPRIPRSPGYVPPELPAGEAQLSTGHGGVVSGPALVTDGAHLVVHDNLQTAGVVGPSHQTKLWF